jgi:hypothetical protein
VIKTTNTIPYIEGLLLLHGLSSEADPEWTLKSSAKKFKEALRVVPGGQAELFALAHVLYQRAQLVSTLDKAIRHLGMPTRTTPANLFPLLIIKNRYGTTLA